MPQTVDILARNGSAPRVAVSDELDAAVVIGSLGVETRDGPAVPGNPHTPVVW